MRSSKSIFILSLALLFIGHFLVDFMIGIWPVYKTIANLDLAIIGLIGGFCAFAGESFQVIFGSLSDRGYRKLLVICGIALSAVSPLLAYTDHYAIIFGICLFTCIGSAAFHPSAVSVIGDLNAIRGGLVMAVFTTGGSLGLASSQLIFSKTYYHVNASVLWLIIPSIAIALLACFYKHTHSLPAIEGQSKKMNFKIFGEFFRRHDLRWLYISQVCNAALLWGMMFLLPDVLNVREYDSWITFGGGHLCLIFGSAVMMIPAGFIADRFSCRSVILYATLIGLVFFYLFLLLPDLNNTTTAIVLFIIGAALGAVNPISVALGTRLAPDNKAAIGAFLMGMVWCFSEAIGQCGGGLLTKLFTEDAPAKSLEILGILFFVGLIAAIRLPHEGETEPQEQPEYA